MIWDQRMTTRTDSSQGESGVPPPPPPPPPPGPLEHLHSRGGNTVFKSGPLFISSKGIGWTSWKKRWFILTRTSLVFFRSDPSAVPQKGSEVNLTLGGIDLNNSGSVEVKADKKLLTVLFPDGRDGRAFTLKSETSEDLYEWKAALENALAQAPSVTHAIGQNVSDRQPAKSSVIGRPVLLALEDVDGAPSFLEKALRFIEEYGVKVEGILRQAAYVDDVEHRVYEYEEGKIEFSPEEDPHVVADCVKYVLRELPSSPVPASCCNALLEACRTDRGVRVHAMRAAICETFPEPNRRLLQRVLVMMQTVASHKAENRMSSSAVAACMAPLLLRPLLAGDCEVENDFDVGGDSSAQLLQAAAAANHAQSIVITLLEEYDSIFREGSISPEPYSDSQDSGTESEEATDDDDESFEDDEHGDATQESDANDDLENASSENCSESGHSRDDDLHDSKDFDGLTLGSKSPEVGDASGASQDLSSNLIQAPVPQHDVLQVSETHLNQSNSSSAMQAIESSGLGEVSKEPSLVTQSSYPSPTSCIKMPTTMVNGLPYSARCRTMWGRTSARKNLSMDSLDYSIEEEVEIQRLEATKTELESRIAVEAKGNSVLQASLERRKKALHERRLALEQDVARLQEQLQRERELRTTLEAGTQGHLPVLAAIDEKTKTEVAEIAQAEADVINLKQHVEDLEAQLNQQREQNSGSMHSSFSKLQQTPYTQAKQKDKRKDTEATATSLLEGSRNKVANSTPSALSKLTTRLNFLKERRSQITNELQNMDKGRESGLFVQNLEKGRGGEPGVSLQNPEKVQGFEAQSVQYPDIGEEGLNYCTLPFNPSKRVGTEGQSFANPERFRKSDGLSRRIGEID